MISICFGSVSRELARLVIRSCDPNGDWDGRSLQQAFKQQRNGNVAGAGLSCVLLSHMWREGVMFHQMPGEASGRVLRPAGIHLDLMCHRQIPAHAACFWFTAPSYSCDNGQFWTDVHMLEEKDHILYFRLLLLLPFRGKLQFITRVKSCKWTHGTWSFNTLITTRWVKVLSLAIS